MSTSLVLIVIGDDRPGLVEELAATIASHGGNWLESRMTQLAGKFAGIVRVQLEEAQARALVRELEGLRSRGLKVLAEAGAVAGVPARGVRLELVGADHPGIVRQVAAALARRGVNVEDLLTECIEAPHTGQPLFRAAIRLRLPPGQSLEALRDELEGLARDLMVDLSLAGDEGESGRGGRPQGS